MISIRLSYNSPTLLKELDDAALRRFPKRIHVCMPDVATRRHLLERLLRQVKSKDCLFAYCILRRPGWNTHRWIIDSLMKMIYHLPSFDPESSQSHRRSIKHDRPTEPRVLGKRLNQLGQRRRHGTSQGVDSQRCYGWRRRCWWG